MGMSYAPLWIAPCPILVEIVPDDPVICDFDVLFNPDYKVDVLSVLVGACKKKSFSAIWPGRLNGNRLIYAEEQFRDYKEYDIGAYDITCVI